MMGYPITELTKEDFQQAVDLAVTCFGENTRKIAEDEFGATFADYPYRPKTFVAKDGNRIIGIIQSMTMYVATGPQAYAWIGVHPDYRRQGLGRALLSYAEEETIRDRFHDSPGTFLLVAAHDPNYYLSQGYQLGNINTHRGIPFLVKHYKPPVT